tara:strand:- start:1749 stop:2537 length:789 start_codon:yes stop_codon:yes gene_type:complete
MSLWDAVFLGFLQGTTEFLPISSSGHLVVGQTLLGIEIPGVQFEVAVHLATLVSIVAVYHLRIKNIICGVIAGEHHSLQYVMFLIVGTLPIVIVGLLFKDSIEVMFENPFVPGIAFFFTGFLLWTTRKALSRKNWPGLSLLAVCIIGMAQALAVVPGISRSGATVVAALWMGVKTEDAAAFSFLLAIPAIFGATILQLGGLTDLGHSLTPIFLMLGSITAAITGVLAIFAFLDFLSKKTFYKFGIYCWALGTVFLVYLVLIG